jgi:GMP synthase (glutamine-hydrolysing)
MKKNEIRILLIQIRENEDVKKEELESFTKYATLNKNQFTTLDVFKDPNFSVDLNKFDAVIFGGASEASVLEPEKYPFVESIKRLMNECLEKCTPVFASCFGFQVSVLAFGGEIMRDRENFEMGTYPITLTKQARIDPIFKEVPDQFQAVSVHQEKAVTLPSNCELLGHTAECCHAFKVKNKSFWAFQFHPELDKDCLTQRLNIYKEKYTEDKDHFQEIIDSVKETPYSNKLVQYFIENVLLKANS